MTFLNPMAFLLLLAVPPLIALYFLNPFQIYDRCYADQQVNMMRDIDVISNDSAVQSFVNEYVGVLRKRLPGRKSPCLLPVARGAFLIVQIKTCISGTLIAVFAKQGFEFIEQVRLRAEVTDGASRSTLPGVSEVSHFITLVLVEAVALDKSRINRCTLKKCVKRSAH